MYVIIGATGNTGSKVASILLEAGKKVRIISRDAEKAKELTDKGAELFQGIAEDVKLLKRAFEGATAVYSVLPMDWQVEDFNAHRIKNVVAISEAMKACNVKYVVSLSSQGAHLESNSGVLKALHKMEQLFDKIEGLNTLHLRPCYFMENTLGMVGLIKEAGIMGSPIKSDLLMPVIATKDVGDYASKRLLALDFEGHNVQDLLGARNVTYSEMAKVYGTAIGKPDLNYVEFSYEDFKNAFMGMGASESLADNMNTLIKRINAEEVTIAERDTQNTTLTTIEDFADTFNYVYNM